MYLHIYVSLKENVERDTRGYLKKREVDKGKGEGVKRREKLKNGKNIQTQQKVIKSLSSYPGCHSHTLRGFFYLFPDIIYECLGYTYQIYIGCFKHEIYEII